MIELARLSRGFSQKILSEKIGIEQSTLSKIENDNLSIRHELIKVIASTLKYPIGFFYEDIKMLSPLVVHYRKRKSIDSVNIAFVESNLYIKKHIIKKLLRSIDLPYKVYDLNPYEYQSPENAARILRQKWFIPKGPIKNLVQCVEAAGIIVLFTEYNNPKLMGELLPDEHGVSVIYINRNMPPDRQRFTLAHELGHLMMHSGDYFPNIEDAENEAHKFASEFLMPEREIKPALSFSLTLQKLADLKRYWKCSMSAIIMRAGQLKTINDEKKGNLFIKMSSAGFNKIEPDCGIKQEIPALINQLFKLHLTELEYTEEQLAELLNLYTSEVMNMKDYYSPDTLKAIRRIA